MKPTSHLLYGLIIWLTIGLTYAFLPNMDWLESLWSAFGAIILLTALLDAALLYSIKQLSIHRQVNKNLPINSWSNVTLTLDNQHGRGMSLEVFDYTPAELTTEGMPNQLSLGAYSKASITYRIMPTQRGHSVFNGVDVRIRSPLTLWKRVRHLECKNDVRVYPNFADIAKYTLLATSNHLSQFGVRRKQRRGEGQDFHQLREYRVGDSSKQINWKATARMRKLISEEYQDERDQRIVFLLDCGRRMRHEADGVKHLDQALNAMLLLSYVGIRQGDAVGFLSFSGNEQWVAPQKGAHTVNLLLNRTYDIHSSTEPSDYLQAARKFMGLHPRRCLVVLMTNTRAEDHSELKQAVQLLSLKHLVIVADLQEPCLKESMQKPIEILDDALEFHGTMNYLSNRTHTHELLNHSGAICIDTTAQQLPIALVNKYLAIKDSGRL